LCLCVCVCVCVGGVYILAVSLQQPVLRFFFEGMKVQYTHFSKEEEEEPPSVMRSM